MIADDIRISQFRSDDLAANEGKDDVASLMEAARVIYRLLVIPAQENFTSPGGWHARAWGNVDEHIRRAVQELEEGELEKE